MAALELKDILADSANMPDGTRSELIHEAKDAIRAALVDLIAKHKLSATPTHSELAYALFYNAVELNPHQDGDDRFIFEQFLDEALNECTYPADPETIIPFGATIQ